MDIDLDTEITFPDLSEYIYCKNKQDFENKVKGYYNTPPDSPDLPSSGTEWKNKCPEVEELGYNPYFEYQHNLGGFRDSEIETDVDVCYFGCSITYGVGVPLEARWTNLVDKEFEFKSNNFGIPGSSTGEMFKLFMTTSRFIKMKKAIFLLPDIYRCTIPMLIEGTHQGGNMRIHPDYTRFVEKNDFLKKCGYLNTCKHLYSLPDSYFIDKVKLEIETIIYIAEVNQIELYFGTWTNITNLLKNMAKNYNHVKVVDRMFVDGRARDCTVPPWGHPGILPNKQFAENVINVIKSNG